MYIHIKRVVVYLKKYSNVCHVTCRILRNLFFNIYLILEKKLLIKLSTNIISHNELRGHINLFVLIVYLHNDDMNYIYFKLFLLK
jgi:hypothetical protein